MWLTWTNFLHEFYNLLEAGRKRLSSYQLFEQKAAGVEFLARINRILFDFRFATQAFALSCF
jgi:hypothetical protein